MAAVGGVQMFHTMGNFFHRRRDHPQHSATNSTTSNDAHVQRSSLSSSPAPLTTVPTRSTTRSRRRSVLRTDSELRHDEYIDKLEVPTLEQISGIAQIQEEKEREVQQKYHGSPERSQQEEQAAEKIQRTYRGHRVRRQMEGLTLDPTTRWIEALKAARYQNITDPKRRRLSNATVGRPSTSRTTGSSNSDSSEDHYRTTGARSNWHHISSIASHAIGDLPRRSNTISETSQDGKVSQELHGKPTGNDNVAKHGDEALSSKEKRQQKIRNSWAGKMMDLPYFLEMVDQKHRYGSNLRAYHELWKQSDTTQSYFYWLDHGEGKDVEHQNVSRKRLEREQVRYLSREERMNYLVHVDGEGRLVYAKDGKRITTSTEYKDSVDGIVPIDSEAKAWREDEVKALEERKDSESSQSSSGGWSASSGSPTISPLPSPTADDAERRYPDPSSLKEAKGPRKIKHVSAQAILNRLLRKTLIKQNTWIFAVDTSMNVYVGIKQSGSFQHSSFMRGSRLSAAGTLKIKDGQLRSISPLSGHYRPPAKAFRHLVHHLEDIGVDMSRVSISKAYAVLVGLDAYIRVRSKGKNARKKVQRGAEQVIHPAKAREAKLKEIDMSESARKEREKQREAKHPLSRVLEDAKEKVGERWAALDAGVAHTHQDQVPAIPEPNVPHQHGLDKAYKEDEVEGDTAKESEEIVAQTNPSSDKQ